MPTLPPELRRVKPASFVEARDALARRLRQKGDRGAAAEVRRLRRPPAPLWALNQLAEVAPDPLAALIRAGDALRATTQAALQGEGADLGRLSSEHGRLVAELTGRAMKVLAELPAPTTQDTQSRVWSMLRVASLDPDLAAGLAEGSLAEEPVGGGFDGLLGLEAAFAPARGEAEREEPEGRGPAAPAEKPAPAPPAPAVPVDDARRRAEHEREVRDARSQVERARAEVARRRDRHERVHDRVTRLRSQLEAVARDAEQADRELTAAEDELSAAERLLGRLQGE